MRRVLDRLDELYAVGGGPGANRPSGSAGEDEAHRLVEGWMREAGLEIEVDPDRNLIGRSSRRPDVWVGSHLDSVPHGGKFDGALGVVAAIEAVDRAGAGAAVAFRGEEVGCIGSRALVARGGPFPDAFLELHVEQGPRLAQADAPLGVVTAIVAVARGELVVDGRAGHAGTTPMDSREDALVKAAERILRIREIAREIDGAVATVGQLTVEPGTAGVPSAMLFVRSLAGGVSHSPDERSSDDDVELGVDVLTAALARLTGRLG